MNKVTLDGKLNLKNTAGKFNQLINDNKEVFRRYFETNLFPGSLNVKVETPSDIQQNLDRGVFKPQFVIPRNELIGMPDYIGDGQTWPCKLSCVKFRSPIDCWVFRRIGSIVPKGIIELVAEQELVEPFALQDGDPVTLEVFIGD